MAFTQEQERVLKLMVNEFIARMKLNAANRKMGDEIRAAVKPTDDSIRAEWKSVYEPLQTKANEEREKLKAEFE